MQRDSPSLILVKEALRTRDSQDIPQYREDLVKNTLIEIKNLTADGQKELYASVATRKAFVDRSKRCVLAYQKERIERYKKLFWRCGASTSSVLPEKSQQAASIHELNFIKEYQELVTEWKGLWLDIDVGASICPPKDVFVEIRVIQECGEIMTDSGPLLLSRGTQRFVMRSDVEDLIQSGKVHLL